MARLPRNKEIIGFAVGSDSDLDMVDEAEGIFEDFGVKAEWAIKSAHRTPDEMFEWASTAEDRGLEAIIGAAGGSAHLAPMMASKTVLPVIAVGVDRKNNANNSAVASQIEMPPGVPLLFTGLNQSGAKNAALAAIRIAGSKYPVLRERMRDYKQNLGNEVRDKNDKLHKIGLGAYRAEQIRAKLAKSISAEVDHMELIQAEQDRRLGIER